MKTIFDEVNLKYLHVKNRLVRSATWEALAKPDGSPSAEQLKVYEELAQGGVGTIITGFITVTDNDSYIKGMARLSNYMVINGWKELVDIVHQYDCKVITQLALGEFMVNNRTLDADNCRKEELRYLVSIFGEAAKRAKTAGFDGIQIHGAHNFWLSRFLSPAYNHRSDSYGGSQKNRTKLIVEILKEIRKNAPDLHITMKINSSDFFEGGLTPEDALTTCTIMAKEGIDSVEISGNGTSVAGIRPGIDEAYFLPFAEKLKKQCNVPVMLVGGHRSIENMEKILNETNIELLAISRPLVRESELPNRWQSKDLSPAKCVSCNMCYQTPGHRCIFVLREQQKS